MTKIFFYYIYFESNRNFTTEHLKTVKIAGFFSKFLKFQVKWQPCNHKRKDLLSVSGLISLKKKGINNRCLTSEIYFKLY